MLASHEDTASWAESYRFIKNLDKCPKFRMGDGAKEITNAGVEVFSEDGIRLMCWPHVYRNLGPKLSQLRKINKSLAESVLEDIEFLQWAAVKESFEYLFKLLEKKYVEDSTLTDKERDECCMFFDYFREQWGPNSHVHRWYEAAYPWGIGSNQGIEGTNKAIKASHTFKRRAPLGTFMDIVGRMISEWSERDDTLLNGRRMDMLSSDPNGLRLKTEGFQWWKSQKIGTSKIFKVNPKDKFTILGTSYSDRNVDWIWVVESSVNTLKQPLIDRAKGRLSSRGSPSFSHFNDFKEVRQSCWIIEESDGEFYCDCPVCMKVNSILFLKIK